MTGRHVATDRDVYKDAVEGSLEYLALRGALTTELRNNGRHVNDTFGAANIRGIMATAMFPRWQGFTEAVLP